MNEASDVEILNWGSRHVRMLLVLRRFWKLLFRPSEAMRGIAAAPDTGGVVVIMIVQGILWVLSVWEMFIKLNFVGGYVGEMGSLATIFAATALLFPMPVILGLKWAAKSFLVKYGFASGGDWDFKTAASVTGYAYVADVVMTVLNLVAAWFLIPSRVIEVGSQGTALGVMGWWQAETRALKLTVMLPVTIFCLVWKGYLGGLGAHFGTERCCSIIKGTVLFTLLGALSFWLGFSVA